MTYLRFVIFFSNNNFLLYYVLHHITKLDIVFYFGYTTLTAMIKSLNFPHKLNWQITLCFFDLRF